MRVILLKEIPTLGRAGDVKSVADGYARNFLIRRGLATQATGENIKALERRAAEVTRNETRERAEFQALTEKLRAVELRFPLKMNERDQAFGSITAQDIAEALAKHGVTVQKNWIELEHGIKTTGEHDVKITFPHHIEVEVKIIVEVEDSTQQVKQVK